MTGLVSPEERRDLHRMLVMALWPDLLFCVLVGLALGIVVTKLVWLLP